MPEDSGATRSRRSRPATTPEGRESQLVALAFDAIEKRIRMGQATAQELVHFAKLGSPREDMERMKLQHENDLLQVKREQIANVERSEARYMEVINALRMYNGQDPIDQSVDDE